MGTNVRIFKCFYDYYLTGFAGLSTVFTNDTKHESQLTRSRRSVVKANDNGQCYRQFFVGGKPPEGFSAGEGKNIRYICQMYGNTPCFSTMFDLDYGIPIYSAYVVRGDQLQTSKFGTFKNKTKFHQEPGERQVSYTQICSILLKEREGVKK